MLPARDAATLDAASVHDNAAEQETAPAWLSIRPVSGLLLTRELVRRDGAGPRRFTHWLMWPGTFQAAVASAVPSAEVIVEFAGPDQKTLSGSPVSARPPGVAASVGWELHIAVISVPAEGSDAETLDCMAAPDASDALPPEGATGHLVPAAGWTVRTSGRICPRPCGASPCRRAAIPRRTRTARP